MAGGHRKILTILKILKIVCVFKICHFWKSNVQDKKYLTIKIQLLKIRHYTPYTQKCKPRSTVKLTIRFSGIYTLQMYYIRSYTYKYILHIYIYCIGVTIRCFKIETLFVIYSIYHTDDPVFEWNNTVFRYGT